MSLSRKLAAIMFTDIVGYTKLMGENEQKAFEALNENRQVQRPIIERFNGRFIKEVGDGIIASFNTASDAVYCAATIHSALKQNNDLDIRVGIHLGEVVFTEEDVFGDGVNIAARLQSIAPEGGTLVSEAVHRNIVNKPGIESQFLRQERLKNVADPQKLYRVSIIEPESYQSKLQPETAKSNHSRNYLIWTAIVTAVLIIGLLFYFTVRTDEPVIRDKSIAILPFYNMSTDPEQEYFSDGITEEIINILAQVPDLKVVSRTSSFQFRGKETDIKEIAKSLGVATILEGSVRKFENKIRITAQLINAEDGFHIWSESYERELVDVFAIQDDLSRSIVAALKIKIGMQNDPLLRLIPFNLTAHNYYLKGRHFWNQRTPQGLQKAIGFFEQALAEDSLFALAYSGLADAYNQLSAWGYLDPGVAAVQAKTAAEKAIAIDPNLGQPFAALGFTQMIYDWDFEHSKINYLKAIEINPNYPSAHMWLGAFYEIMGKRELAKTEHQIATELDPLSVVININLARYYLCAGDLNKALVQANKTMELGGEYPAYYTMFQTYYAKREYDEAFEHFEKWRAAFDEDPQLLQTGYSKSGWQGVAKVMIPRLEEKAKNEYIRPITFAEYYMLLEDYSRALDYLELAYETKDAMVVTIGVVPFWEVLYDEPRFKEIIRKIGLPPVS